MVGLAAQDVRELRRLNKQEKARKKEIKAKKKKANNNNNNNRTSLSDSVTLVEDNDSYRATSPTPNRSPNSTRTR